MSSNMMEVSITDLKRWCIAALQNKGATDNEATAVFEDYLDAELRGRLSHGFMSFGVALAAFPHTGSFEIAHQSGSVITIDGNGDCGHVVARAAVDMGLKGLDDRKISTIGIRNITRFNCPGPIARYAAQRGAIAVVLEYGGQNFMIPYGGVKAALSTNPIGIGFPGVEPLFVLDIATSERALGYVTLAKLGGGAIPTAWGVDAEGHPTSDPHKLSAVSPFGGYKGYALALAFELLSGALVGVEIGSKGTLGQRGALILLIHPTIFGHSTESFSKQMQSFLNEVVATPPRDLNVPVSYPGQQGEERIQKALSSGVVSLSVSIVNDIKKAA